MQILNGKKKATKCLKKWIWEGLGLHLGRVWDGLGLLSELLGASGPFFDRSKSNFYKALVQEGLQEAFWIDFGWLWEGFGTNFGWIWEDLGRIFGNFGTKFLEDLEQNLVESYRI